MLKDDEEIGKRVAWPKIMRRLYVYVHLICHLFITVYR